MRTREFGRLNGSGARAERHQQAVTRKFTCPGQARMYRSGPRVRLVIGRYEPINADMRVELSGGQRGVAEHLLNAAQVGAAFQQVRGSRVAQPVGSGVGHRSGRGDASVHHPADSARVDPAAAGTDAAAATAGRPCPCQLRTARTAGSPTGTTRSLLRLPRTLTVRRPVSRSPTSSPHSSLTRIPVA